MSLLNGILLGLWAVMFIGAIIAKENKTYIANNGMWVLNFTYLSIRSHLMAPICIMSEIIMAIYCSILVYLWCHDATANGNNAKNDYFYAVLDAIIAIVYIVSVIVHLVV